MTPFIDSYIQHAHKYVLLKLSGNDGGFLHVLRLEFRDFMYSMILCAKGKCAIRSQATQDLAHRLPLAAVYQSHCAGFF